MQTVQAAHPGVAPAEAAEAGGKMKKRTGGAEASVRRQRAGEAQLNPEKAAKKAAKEAKKAKATAKAEAKRAAEAAELNAWIDTI